MALSAPKLEAVAIAGPAGNIEASVELAAEAAGPVAVICHPHPVHGGTMRNKVVHTLARALVSMNVTAVRFNFRGTGASEGSYDEGRGELDDALAVLDWASQRWPHQPLWLAGFSFGAWVAMRAASRRPVQQLVTVAPPIDKYALDDFTAPTCPWLLVQGGADELIDADAVVQWAARLKVRPEVILLPGVDHFFHGRLNELKSRMLEALARPVDGSRRQDQENDAEQF